MTGIEGEKGEATEKGTTRKLPDETPIFPAQTPIQNYLKPGDPEKTRRASSSEEHLSGVFHVTFIRAVGTLEPAALAESLERLFRNDVPTGHHHRRVLISSLLLGNGADKD